MEYKGTSGNDTLDQAKLNLPNGVHIFGGDGDDTITFSNGIANGDAGNDTLIATSPDATIAYWNAPRGVTVNLAKGEADDGFGTTDKLIGVRNVQGSPWDDTMIGSSANEYFYGGSGSNTVVGGGGHDVFSYYFPKSMASSISYEAATDTFTITYKAGGLQGTDKLTGISRIQFGTGPADTEVVERAQFVGDFRPTTKPISIVFPSGTGLVQFKGGDFNGDGKADFLAVGQTGTGLAPAPSYIFLGDGKDGFADASASIFATPPMAVTGGGRTLVADFNNDGQSDIFQLDFGNDAPPFAGGQNHLYLSSGATRQLVDASATLPRTIDLNHGGSVGDVNGDGYLDVLVNTLGPAGDVMLINDGTGHFKARPDLLPSASGVAATHTFSGMVDVNGDGHLDLVMGRWDGDPTHSASKVLLNDGHGDFTKIAPIELPASGVGKDIVLDVDAIDLNGDGFADLMLSVTNGGDFNEFYRTPYIQLLVNDGAGNFRDETAARLPQPLKAPGDAQGWIMSLTAVDFNRDGLMDILAEPNGRGLVPTVYLNRGNGTFGAGWQASEEASAFAADVNGDGKVDIVTAAQGGYFTRAELNSMQSLQQGSSGNDTFAPRPGDNAIDGGAGTDTVAYSGKRDAYIVSQAGDGCIVKSRVTGAVDTSSNVERLQFGDTMVALDISGVGGQAYRIYQAAFNRVPDEVGLGFWIAMMDKGVTLHDVAQGFVDSPEFKDLYGANASNREILNKMYDNVLHRAPDPGGFAFYLGLLDQKVITVTDLLADISESPENKAALVGAISNGFSYSAFLG